MSKSTPLTAPFAGVIGFAALAVTLVGMIVIMLSLNLITGLAMLFGGLPGGACPSSC